MENMFRIPELEEPMEETKPLKLPGGMIKKPGKPGGGISVTGAANSRCPIGIVTMMMLVMIPLFGFQYLE